MTADTNPGGGGTIFLAVLLGTALAGLGIAGFFMWDNYKSHQGAQPPP